MCCQTSQNQFNKGKLQFNVIYIYINFSDQIYRKQLKIDCFLKYQEQVAFILEIQERFYIPNINVIYCIKGYKEGNI